MFTGWYAWLSKPEGQEVAARRRHLELMLKDVRNALLRQDVVRRVQDFHAATAGRTPLTHPLSGPDLDLYFALQDLDSMARVLAATHRSVFKSELSVDLLDPLTGGPLPSHWREREAPLLERPHAVSIVTSWREREVQPLPAGDYASHRQLTGWNSPMFGDIPYEDVSDFAFRAPERPSHEGLAYLRYEHQGVLPISEPGRITHMEIGVDCRTAVDRAHLVVQFPSRTSRWRDVLALGAGRNRARSRPNERFFVSIDPALLGSPEARLALKVTPLPGIDTNYGVRVDWLTIRWRERGD